MSQFYEKKIRTGENNGKVKGHFDPNHCDLTSLKFNANLCDPKRTLGKLKERAKRNRHKPIDDSMAQILKQRANKPVKRPLLPITDGMSSDEAGGTYLEHGSGHMVSLVVETPINPRLSNGETGPRVSLAAHYQNNSGDLFNSSSKVAQVKWSQGDNMTINIHPLNFNPGLEKSLDGIPLRLFLPQLPRSFNIALEKKVASSMENEFITDIDVNDPRLEIQRAIKIIKEASNMMEKGNHNQPKAVKFLEEEIQFLEKKLDKLSSSDKPEEKIQEIIDTNMESVFLLEDYLYAINAIKPTPNQRGDI